MPAAERKGLIHVILVSAIISAIYIVVALFVPFVRNDTFWACFVSIWIAIAVMLAANSYVVVTARSMQSALYRVSVSTVSVLYLVVTAVLGFIFMAAATIPLWVAIVSESVLLALCLIGFIGGALGARMIEADVERTAQATSMILQLRSMNSQLLAIASDPVAAKSLTELGDALRFTDPVSSPTTQPFDQTLFELFGSIDASLHQGDANNVARLCGEAEAVIKQRASAARMGKRYA